MPCVYIDMRVESNNTHTSEAEIESENTKTLYMTVLTPTSATMFSI